MKVIVKLDPAAEKMLAKSGRSLSSIVGEDVESIVDEEITIEGEENTRGLFTVLLIHVGVFLATELASAAYKEVIKASAKRIMKPVLNFIEGEKEEELEIIKEYFYLLPLPGGVYRKVPIEQITEEQRKSSTTVLVEVKLRAA